MRIIHEINRKKDEIDDSWEPRRIERVKQFRYLGCVIIKDLLPEIKIKHRIGYAKIAFINIKNLLLNKALKP